ncbi:MAG: hypothetical protein MUC60_03110 [Oscillatoria sp. Prado101]|jgi:hypothetical protein|nr:hypothetical protein [Oscillatoria sp. Prado101]
MPIQDTGTQVTFHYVSGQSETFSIRATAQEFYRQLQLVSDSGWLTMHLLDQTVTISIDKVMKVEVKPAFPEIKGDGFFSDAQRVSALQRGAAR